MPCKLLGYLSVSLTKSLKKMESYALPLSPSTPFLIKSKSSNPRIFTPSPSLKPLLHFSSHNNSFSQSSTSTFTNKTSSLSLSLFRLNRKLHHVRTEAAGAASIPDSNAQEGTKVKDSARILQLAGMFGLWYLLNIYYNIFNKQVLKVFPFPATVTAFQFGCGTLLILIMWTFNLHPRPKITRSQLETIVPLALIHTIGNLLTNISIDRVAVSFTHTIKAMEPFFTVLLSSLFLCEKPSIWVVTSLVPIVGGVALASFTEASFNWVGFSTAMASNITNQSRNVLSKKFMVRKEESMDNINLFSVITIFAFILLVPAAILMDGVKFSPSYLQSAASEGLNVRELFVRSLLAGFCFHSYQQVSYMILQMVSAVTHAVGNSVKRVVVIVSSVMFFRTPVSPVNSLGTGIALVGVFLYSRAKRIKPKQDDPKMS